MLSGNPLALGNAEAASSGFITAGAATMDNVIALDVMLRRQLNGTAVTVNAGATLTLAGRLSGGTGADLTKVGPDTLVLNNENSYRGTTLVNEGVLNVQNNGALGGTGISEVQTVTVSGTSETFTLTFNGELLPTVFNAADPNLAAAIENGLVAQAGLLQNDTDIDGDRLAVSQAGNVYTITFGGSLSGFDQPQILVGAAGAIGFSRTRHRQRDPGHGPQRRHSRSGIQRRPAPLQPAATDL
jgi:autotransporter-associated beta strand protein